MLHQQLRQNNLNRGSQEGHNGHPEVRHAADRPRESRVDDAQRRELSYPIMVEREVNDDVNLVGQTLPNDNGETPSLRLAAATAACKHNLPTWPHPRSRST